MRSGSFSSGHSASILLPSDITSSSPSSRDGIASQDEVLHRILGCELILEAGMQLSFPQSIINTGCILFHRFYYRKSLKKYDVLSVSMGSLLLAAKIEEFPILLRDIILAFHKIYCNRSPQHSRQELDVGGKAYLQWKSALITIERYILKELGFSFYSILDHPHKFLIVYLKVNGIILQHIVSIRNRKYHVTRAFVNYLGIF